MDAGIVYFNTAPSNGLGLSERRVGYALREHRGHVLVSSKVGRLLLPTDRVEPSERYRFLTPAVLAALRLYP